VDASKRLQRIQMLPEGSVAKVIEARRRRRLTQRNPSCIPEEISAGEVFYTVNQNILTMFFVEILRYPGPPKEELRSRHQSYVREQGQRGRVVLAGRFADVSGGIIMWKSSSKDEAENLAANDPYALEKYATYQLKEWSYNPGFDFTKTTLSEK
jgi:uncharacterized protein YciI